MGKVEIEGDVGTIHSLDKSLNEIEVIPATPLIGINMLFDVAFESA